mgnify:CR=1 FL=1
MPCYSVTAAGIAEGFVCGAEEKGIACVYCHDAPEGASAAADEEMED